MSAIDIRERQYISLFGTDVLGLALKPGGEDRNADGDVVISFIREAVGDTAAVTVFSRVATNIATGLYETPLTSQETSVSGPYTVVWTYTMFGQAQEYRTYAEVGMAAPSYDALPWEMKDVVDTTWVRFADLFDSPGGGPNLMTYFQTNFGRQRMAELLRIAVGTLNTVAQPYQTYTVDGIGQAAFPVTKWGPLLEKSLYIEAVKHLIRSYTEQPMFVGGAVTRLDRRDYMDRWRMVLQDEEPDFRRQLEVFKIANMGLGKAAVLVSGGVYGRYGPTRLAGSVAARPRMWTRWY